MVECKPFCCLFWGFLYILPGHLSAELWGLWALGFGPWPLAFGLLDLGLWAVAFGLSAFGLLPLPCCLSSFGLLYIYIYSRAICQQNFWALAFGLWALGFGALEGKASTKHQAPSTTQNTTQNTTNKKSSPAARAAGAQAWHTKGVA